MIRKTGSSAWVGRRLPAVLVALAIGSIAAQAAMMTVLQNTSTAYLRAESFDLGSSFVVDTTSITVAAKDGTAAGTEASPVELAPATPVTGACPEARTAVTRNHWVYTAVLKEKGASSITAGSFAVELYLSGDTLANQLMGTVYVTQATSDGGAVECASVSWDLGASMPDAPLFLVKAGPYVPSGNSVTYTIQSAYDAVNGFRWRGVGGSIDGQYNPTITAAAGTTIHFVVRHGSDAGDDVPHNLRITDSAGTKLTESADVNDPGDETTLDWTPGAAGSYPYKCKYHSGSQAGTISVS